MTETVKEDRGQNPQQNLRDLSAVAFVAKLASRAPVPGGGGAAALCGAVGSALGNMVIQLTLGKKRYAEYETAHLRIQAELTELQNDLLCMIDRDAEEFLPLAAAYGIKAENEQEKVAKKEKLQAALKNACTVPLQIVTAAHRALLLQQELVPISSKLAISDIACGVQALRAALLCGRINVLINLDLIEDAEFVAQRRAELDELCQEATTIADRVYAEIETKLT